MYQPEQPRPEIKPYTLTAVPRTPTDDLRHVPTFVLDMLIHGILSPMVDCSPPLGASSANLLNDHRDTQHSQKIVTAPIANLGFEQLVGGGACMCDMHGDGKA